jgi:hypothetical protein
MVQLKSFAPAHSAGILPAFGLAKRRTTRFETTTSTFSRRDRHHCAISLLSILSSSNVA